MFINDFIWDYDNIEHISRHQVQDYEVEEVILFDKPLFLKGKEEKYYAYGVTAAGRYLFIVFAVRGDGLIRVITARNMAFKERRFYKKKRE